jgi:hypothetical protein
MGELETCLDAIASMYKKQGYKEAARSHRIRLGSFDNHTGGRK